MALVSFFRSKPFDLYRHNVYSQFGEDGVIQELLQSLGEFSSPGPKWCVEFGAWDGVHLSNTFHLIEQHGFHGVCIEGDETKYKDLLVTAQGFPRMVPLLEYVSHFEAGKTLNDILHGTECPLDFQLLSIDIDSYDYQVWESFEHYRPRIVVIEINSGFVPGVEFIHHPPETLGSSFTVTLKLGEKKGYCLVCHTGNMIFVRNDLLEKLGNSRLRVREPARLFDRSFLPRGRFGK